jgi:hypothetical protein
MLGFWISPGSMHGLTRASLKQLASKLHPRLPSDPAALIRY